MATAAKAYTVAYTMGIWDKERHVDVIATNKAEAYEKAEDKIPTIEGGHAWAIWVHSVTHGNGNEHRFNTFAGKRF